MSDMNSSPAPRMSADMHVTEAWRHANTAWKIRSQGATAHGEAREWSQSHFHALLAQTEAILVMTEEMRQLVALLRGQGGEER